MTRAQSKSVVSIAGIDGVPSVIDGAAMAESMVSHGRNGPTETGVPSRNRLRLPSRLTPFQFGFAICGRMA